jgi:hypothetical protein
MDASQENRFQTLIQAAKELPPAFMKLDKLVHLHEECATAYAQGRAPGKATKKSFSTSLTIQEKLLKTALEKYEENKEICDALIQRHRELSARTREPSLLASRTLRDKFNRVRAARDTAQTILETKPDFFKKGLKANLDRWEEALKAVPEEDPQKRWMQRGAELNETVTKCEKWKTSLESFATQANRDDVNHDIREFNRCLHEIKAEKQKKSCNDEGCDVTELAKYFDELVNAYKITCDSEFRVCRKCNNNTPCLVVKENELCATHYYEEHVIPGIQRMKRRLKGVVMGDELMGLGEQLEQLQNQIDPMRAMEMSLLRNIQTTVKQMDSIIPEANESSSSSSSSGSEEDNSSEQETGSSSGSGSDDEKPNLRKRSRSPEDNFQSHALGRVIENFEQDASKQDIVHLLKLIRDGNEAAFENATENRDNGLYAVVASVITEGIPYRESTHTTYEEAEQALKKHKPVTKYIQRSILKIK